MVMLKPEGLNPGSLGDAVATYAFLALSLLGTINAVLGVWWAGHMVPQARRLLINYSLLNITRGYNNVPHAPPATFLYLIS